MSFKHGKNTVVFVDQYDLSAYLNSFDPSYEVELPPTTTFGSVGVRRQVVGHKDATASFGGLHDTTAGATHPVFTGALGAATASVVTVGKEGTTIGLPAEMLSGRAQALSGSVAVDGAVPLTLNAQGDDGFDFGVFLFAKAATTGSANSASVDNAAATANGGVGHIHCTLVSGSSPTLDVVIADSADDSSFATIGTFTQLVAAGKQRLELAAGSAVRRYTRVTRTIGGSSTPTFTFSVAFARR